MKKPILIACSDIHLTLKPPRARCNQEDWLANQAHYLQVLDCLAKEHKVPVVCAGDVFDHWKAEPELINFALEYLPDHLIAIPGQHDLPFHNHDQIRKSAYYTLERSGKILSPVYYEDISFRYFPWGKDIVPEKDKNEELHHVAVIHKYFWEGSHCYQGAPTENESGNFTSCLKGYDVAIFGDNHKGFITEVGNTSVINCGTFFRRKADEKEYKPMVGIVYDDYSIEPFYFDTSGDVFTTDSDASLSLSSNYQSEDFNEFIQELSNMKAGRMDFKSYLMEVVERDSVSKDIVDIILKALEDTNE